jgi:glutaredoxin
VIQEKHEGLETTRDLTGRRSRLTFPARYSMIKPERVRLFIKPYCGWCREAMRWLDHRGVAYETLDVITDATAYSEMLRLSHQTLAPVIEVDGKVLADFGARELEQWWAQQGLAA